MQQLARAVPRLRRARELRRRESVEARDDRRRAAEARRRQRGHRNHRVVRAAHVQLADVGSAIGGTAGCACACTRYVLPCRLKSLM